MVKSKEEKTSSVKVRLLFATYRRTKYKKTRKKKKDSCPQQTREKDREGR
jgi:hypothetical protein